MVKALANLGYAASATGDLERAQAHYEEALAVAERRATASSRSTA